MLGSLRILVTVIVLNGFTLTGFTLTSPDRAAHLLLIEAAQRVGAVAVGIAAVPVLVDFLAQSEGRGGEIVRQSEEDPISSSLRRDPKRPA